MARRTNPRTGGKGSNDRSLEKRGGYTAPKTPTTAKDLPKAPPGPAPGTKGAGSGSGK
jgi:hypothetical protein